MRSTICESIDPLTSTRHIWVTACRHRRLLSSVGCRAGGPPRMCRPARGRRGPAPLRGPAQLRAPPGALETRPSPPRFPICSEAIANAGPFGQVPNQDVHLRLEEVGVPFRADAGWLWLSRAVCTGNSILPAVAGFNCIRTATEVSLNASTQRSLSAFPVETITVRSKTFKSCRA